jgi:glycosyltransferase involved in cell wall biosynthesis
MPKFVLILMVKNEEKIIRRCMTAVEGIVDAYVITDTCSTDTTTDIVLDFLKTHEGCLEVSSWKNFGHNRTASFKNAQDYCKSKQWDLKDTYGLLLDADMVFVPGTLKQHALGEIGYTMIQCNGDLEYPNTRLIRMDHDWVCRGVTHEYWDGNSVSLSKNVCYISDHNDGGCKADKFTRDRSLLEKGLEEEPNNPRYLFYLAQTHHSLGDWEKAIEFYKRRIEVGGWYEEIWFSHYMIAKTYATLDKPYQVEEWVQRAYDVHPKRAEALYFLTKYLRERGQHYKAYHYLLQGKAIPLTTDSLFIETDVYNGLFDYEQTVLDYYVRTDPMDGVQSCVRYMLKLGHFYPNVLSNLKFYIRPIASTRRLLNIVSPFGEEYTASAASILVYPIANVRFVNYRVIDGNFVTPNNISLCENACFNISTGRLITKMDDTTVSLPIIDHHIRGLEDIRTYSNKSGQFEFTATVHNYEKDAICILRGRYSPAGTYSECKILPSPTGAVCEKNWLAVPTTDTMIYQWHPLTILDADGVVMKRIQTPPLFSLFRGSAPPIRVGETWWTLVHIVSYEQPRRYYHLIVEMNVDMKPIRITLPFVFVSAAIEYCLSIRRQESTLYCYAGINETDLSEFAIPVSEFKWTSL